MTRERVPRREERQAAGNWPVVDGFLARATSRVLPRAGSRRWSEDPGGHLYPDDPVDVSPGPHQTRQMAVGHRVVHRGGPRERFTADARDGQDGTAQC